MQLEGSVFVVVDHPIEQQRTLIEIPLAADFFAVAIFGAVVRACIASG